MKRSSYIASSIIVVSGLASVSIALAANRPAGSIPEDLKKPQAAPANGGPQNNFLVPDPGGQHFNCPDTMNPDRVKFADSVSDADIAAWKKLISDYTPRQLDFYSGPVNTSMQTVDGTVDIKEFADGVISKDMDIDVAARELLSCPRHTGCFDPKTKITMADGTTKLAEDISAGDLLMNPLTKRGEKVKHITEGPEVLPLVEIGFDSYRVKVSQQHPIKTDTGVKKAAEVVLGDSIMGADGKFHRISILDRLPVTSRQRVINFEVEAADSADDHMVLSDGIVTGDLALQNKLKGKK